MSAPRIRRVRWYRPLVLASSSPRRRELLERVGVPLEVQPVRLEESFRRGESARRGVLRLAHEKAAAVARQRPHRVVLAADTIVLVDGLLLGKPRDERQARAMLRRLSDRWHQVLTGVVLVDADGTPREAVSRTRVRFAALGAKEIRRYVASGEPFDKAGGYALQGAASWFVLQVHGSVTNVIGLPLECVRELFADARLPIPSFAGDASSRDAR
ncbi:MAG: septum formation inhibitor Maf [Acidobacteriota bacterium]|nr:MAG: septum formation inhibitor Maf [Acidobacteriota bacterium]